MVPLFDDYLSQARNFDPDNAPDGVTISTIYDSLETTYKDAMDGSAGKIESKDTRIKELESELSRVKQHNYDLMSMSPAPNNNNEPDEGNNSDTPGGIDSLFKTETRIK